MLEFKGRVKRDTKYATKYATIPYWLLTVKVLPRIIKDEYSLRFFSCFLVFLFDKHWSISILSVGKKICHAIHYFSKHPFLLTLFREICNIPRLLLGMQTIKLIFACSIQAHTFPQKKRNFNFRILYGDPGPGSVTPDHVHQGKNWWKCCITPDFAIYTLPKKKGNF